jgi:hypothetical protein
MDTHSQVHPRRGSRGRRWGAAVSVALLVVLLTPGAAVAFPAPVGTVVAWGDDSSGQTNVPAALSGVVAVSAGGYHTVALKGDGTVVAWGGDDSHGQTNVPAGLSGVVAISAGGYHTVALKGDGTVVAWGYDDAGQTEVPAALSGVVAVSAGGSHTVALKGDGTVVAWGYDYYGQTDVPAGLSGVIAVSAGARHSVALKGNGTVVAWGNDDYGQTNVPVGLSGVIAVTAGGLHTVALKGDGTVVAWGNNELNQTDLPAGLSGVVAVSAGGYHTLALKADGTVVAWGYDYYGQADVPPGLSGVTAISAGYMHSAAVIGDKTAPETTITSGPAASTTSTTAAFTFTGDDGAGTGVASFQCSLDGAAFTPCTTPVNYSGLAVASHTFAVRAVDRAGNIDPTPATYTWNAALVFTGFTAPVDNPPVVNLANAGQTVPLKWRLTYADGSPVTNLTSVTLTVLNQSCTSGPLDAVGDTAISTSGLQNLGNGYYQYNWKTPKTYTGTCKTLKLDVGDGNAHTALFRFK